MNNQKKIIQGYVPTLIIYSSDGHPLQTQYVKFEGGLTYYFKEAHCLKDKKEAYNLALKYADETVTACATPVNGLCQLMKGKEYMRQPTKEEYENYLNEMEIPDHDLKSNGGRIPDHAKYGTWLRINDPIAFQVGYNEYCRR